jgi:hypothetical protein
MNVQLQRQMQMQPEASATPDAGAMLWSNSTPWRMLVISSCLLTSLAISAPLMLPALQDASEAANCKLAIGTIPTHVFARVTGFVAQDEVPAIRSRVQAQVGGKESPQYLTQRRVSTIGVNSSFITTAVVPDGMAVKVGDTVRLNSRYRDPTLPCNYVPWTINNVP